MKIKLLGSGAWEGIPASFCNCRVCKEARINLDSKNNRTRPSLLLETEEGKVLVEASPDIRFQLKEEVSDILVSHWHFDHMYGLLELHARTKFSIKPSVYASSNTIDWIKNQMGHLVLSLNKLKPFEDFNLKGFKITPLPVEHMYFDKREDDTFGYIFDDGKKVITYLADYHKVSERVIDLVKKSDLVLLDGTYLFEEKYPLNSMTKGEMEDPNHIHGNEILEFAKQFDGKIVFHSISHLSEKAHEELQDLLPSNMFIGYDGMILEKF